MIINTREIAARLVSLVEFLEAERSKLSGSDFDGDHEKIRFLNARIDEVKKESVALYEAKLGFEI